jgi:hypothetical protein
MEPKYKSRSFETSFIAAVDDEAKSQASTTPGSRVKSTPEMLMIAWQFYMEHKDN